MTRIRLVIAGAVLAATPALSSPALAQEGVNLGEGFEATGTLGLRYELDAEEPGNDDREHAFRLHAALGVRYQATDTTTVVLRMRAVNNSGAGDPRDSHVTLGDGLGSTALAFDRAFVSWQEHGVIAQAGLVEHRGGSPLIWDEDLSPAGGSLSYSRRVTRVALTPMVFAYLVRPDGDIDSRAAGVVGGELKAQTLIGDADLEIAAATYRLVRKNALADASTSNLLDANGNFASDFEILEGRARLKLYQLLWFPIELTGSVFINPGADDDKNAFAAGLGSTQRRFGGLLTVGYQFRSIERDAMVAALVRDDFRLATNVTGHELTTTYDYQERVRLGLSLFAFQDKDGDLASTPDLDEGQLQLRGRADLTILF